ncbi:unnamed protein product [Brassica oleracea var. botrytis]|uniref:NB-ARC domain-containing protein n=1 Tax=Brassica oleracea var. oleracea TaxID=109376 RepID=A0A0D3CAI2_BRAOL
MGGCASVSVSCDQTLNQVGRCLTENANHIHNKLDENVETLQVSTQELKVLRDDLLTRVFLEEEKGHRRLATVQRWVFEKIKEVNVLKSRSDFRVVAERVPRSKVKERLIHVPLVGMKAIAEKVCSSLMEDEVGTLGLYGMGGVGKTTLLTQINNIFVNTENDFDVVIWVVVSKDQKMESVQETILWRLGRFSEEWKHLNEEEKASEIRQVLKVLFTTRSKEVCSEMRVDVEMEVKCLAPDEAWELFRMRAGDLTLESHPDIPGVARKIAGKCYGLPLALNVIGG